MHFLKKSVVFLGSFFFGLTLVATLILFQIKFTFGSEVWVKKWLSNSGVYQKIVPSLLSTIEVEGKNGIPFDDPGVVSAFNKVFTPQFLSTTTEQVVDQTYAWLAGDKPDPKIVIDLSAKRDELADNIGIVSKARLDKLPACAPSYVPAQEIDVFTADCVPTYISTASLAQSVEDQLKSSKDFLGDAKISVSAEDLVKNAPGVAKNVPKVYSILGWLPWLLLGWIFFSVVAVIAWSENRRERIKRLVIQMFIVGGFFVGGAILFARAEKNLSKSIIQGADEKGQKVLDELIRPLIISAGRDIMRVQLIFGIVLLAIAVTGLTWLFITRTKKPKVTKADSKPESEDPEAETTKPEPELEPEKQNSP